MTNKPNRIHCPNCRQTYPADDWIKPEIEQAEERGKKWAESELNRLNKRVNDLIVEKLKAKQEGREESDEYWKQRLEAFNQSFEARDRNRAKANVNLSKYLEKAQKEIKQLKAENKKLKGETKMTSNNKSKTAGERGLGLSCGKGVITSPSLGCSSPATSGYQMDIEMNKFKELRELEKGLKEVEILMDIPNLRDGFEVTTTYYMLKKALNQAEERGKIWAESELNRLNKRVNDLIVEKLKAKQEGREEALTDIKKAISPYSFMSKFYRERMLHYNDFEQNLVIIKDRIKEKNNGSI